MKQPAPTADDGRDLPDVHRDPFDRLLVAQARTEGAVVLTADDRLAGYGDAVRLGG